MGQDKYGSLFVDQLKVKSMSGPTATTPMIIGSDVSSHALNASEDLLVSGDLEINGVTWFDGPTMSVASNVIFTVGAINFSSQGADASAFKFSTTFDQFALIVGADLGRQFIIGDASGLTQDFDHATPTNPTLFVHSATPPNTANDEFMSLSHNQTDGTIGCGKGVIDFLDLVATGGGDTASNGYVTIKVAGASVKLMTTA